MSRALVYAFCCGIFTVATLLTISSIAVPRWVSYVDTTPSGHKITYTYGLHSRCSSTGTCTHFPQPKDCHGSDARYFCSIWRSIGFLQSFAVVLELVVITAFITILIGGRAKRQNGWKLLTAGLMLVAGAQCASMSLVAYIYDWDERFFEGWTLDASWVLATVSWCTAVVIAGALVVVGGVLPPEGDYELLK